MFLRSHYYLRLASSYRYCAHTRFSNFRRRHFCESGNLNLLLNEWIRRFEMNGVSEPKESAEIILSHCLGAKSISGVYKSLDRTLNQSEIEKINFLCEERLKNTPVQYIIGEWDFRKITLTMRPPVFIPRPETEQLVDIVLKEIDRTHATHILDLCCGSGAIALSLLHERLPIKATAVDKSNLACSLTKDNAQKLGLDNRMRVINSDVVNLKQLILTEFEIIVSNPPYVFSKDLDQLEAEIKMYEDMKALDGGKEGLDVIKLILDLTSEVLSEGGKLFLEVDPRHPNLLQNYLLHAKSLGLAFCRSYDDFCGKLRFVEIMKFKNKTH